MNYLIEYPQTPCIGVCHINTATGYCIGCWRTLDEISNWGTQSPNEQKIIKLQIKQRMQINQT